MIKYILYGILAITIVFWAYIILAIGNADNVSVFDHNATLENYNRLDIEACARMKNSELSVGIPVKLYLNNGDFYNLSAIQHDLELISAHITSNDLESQMLLYTTLTEDLSVQYQTTLNGYYPDSLYMLLNWLDRINVFAELDDNNSTLFEATMQFWMDRITENIESNFKHNRRLKFSYKFRSIRDRCDHLKFGTVIGDKKVEKLIYNMIDGNWSYVFERVLKATSLLEKALLLLFGILTMYGYICIVRVHLIKPKL